jgi:hypothetical protein
VLDIDIEGGRSHGVDDQHMHVAVVPADDARAVFLPEGDLTLTDHDALLIELDKSLK